MCMPYIAMSDRKLGVGLCEFAKAMYHELKEELRWTKFKCII